MANILWFSDIHIYAHKDNQKRLIDCLNALRWVFDVARERKIKKVVFCGDFFQHKFKIQVLAYFLAYQILEENRDIDVYMLVGNHDLWFHENWDVSSVKPLNSLSNVTIIDEPCTLNIEGIDIDFLPYTKNPIEIINNHFKKKSRILCGHLAVANAKMSNFFGTIADGSVESEKDMSLITIDEFVGWERVFLGHYHMAQKLNDKVEYVGSTLQLNFGEAFQDKHIISMNVDDLSCEYIENNFSPKHYIINLSEMKKYNLENAFVRIKVNDISSINILEKRKEILEKNHVRSLEFNKFEDTKDIDQKEFEDKFSLVKGDILERWIEFSNTKLNKDLLLKIGKEICQSEN